MVINIQSTVVVENCSDKIVEQRCVLPERLAVLWERKDHLWQSITWSYKHKVRTLKEVYFCAVLQPTNLPCLYLQANSLRVSGLSDDVGSVCGRTRVPLRYKRRQQRKLQIMRLRTGYNPTEASEWLLWAPWTLVHERKCEWNAILICRGYTLPSNTSPLCSIALEPHFFVIRVVDW